MKSIESYSLINLDEVAMTIIEHCKDQSLWAFYGEMGAGKTTLIKAICKQLDVRDEISSPTFSLVNEYQTSDKKKVYHFDFYRIKQIEEVYDIGYEDYFYSGAVCLMEWPEKIEELLEDEPHHKIEITKISETERQIVIK